MEAEEVNNIWQNYDAKLEKTLRLNEVILKKINLDGARRELNKPIVSEISTIVCSALFAAYLITVSAMLLETPRYAIPGFSAGASTLALIWFAIVRIHSFRKLDYTSSTTLQLQKQLHDFQLKRYRSGRSELALGLCAATLMWPLVLYTGFNIDVYQEFSVWVLAVVLVAIFAIPFTILHEKYYRKKIENTQTLLREIIDFERKEGS